MSGTEFPKCSVLEHDDHMGCLLNVQILRPFLSRSEVRLRPTENRPGNV